LRRKSQVRASSDIQGVVLSAISDGVPLLKAFRQYRELGIAELAACAHVPAEDIAAAEAGGGLSFDCLSSIAETLRVPVEMLLWHAATSPVEIVDAPETAEAAE
jgi:hypothetical protein